METICLIMNLILIVHLLEGDTLISKHKLHDAVIANPEHPRAWNVLASIAFKQDSFELAMHYGFNALDADPAYTFAAYNMAIQCEDRGLYQQAAELHKRTTQMDSLFVEGYSTLGALYNKMNRPIDAISTLRESLKNSPAHMDNYRVYKNLAEAHYILKEYDTALEYLEQSKALKADYPETEKCFARYYESTGNTESAVLH